MIERVAPTAEEIEEIARRTQARLPAAFAAHLDGVVVRVEDWPEEAVLDELGIEDAYELTGLYSGRPVGSESAFDTGALPSMIHLYRRPILDEWAETGVGLDALVVHILIHEVGHHFGLSDADMNALEDSVR